MLKKIILFIANVTGAEALIRADERKQIAVQIEGASYWFTSYNRYGVVYPFLKYLSSRIKIGYGVNGEHSREQYDALLKCDVFTDREGWSDIVFNEIKGELELYEKQIKNENNGSTKGQ